MEFRYSPYCLMQTSCNRNVNLIPLTFFFVLQDLCCVLCLATFIVTNMTICSLFLEHLAMASIANIDSVPRYFLYVPWVSQGVSFNPWLVKQTLQAVISIVDWCLVIVCIFRCLRTLRMSSDDYLHLVSIRSTWCNKISLFHFSRDKQYIEPLVFFAWYISQ